MYSIFWYTQLNFRGFGVLAVVFTSSSCICTHTTCFKISHRSVILKRFNICDLCCLWNAQCVCILVMLFVSLTLYHLRLLFNPSPVGGVIGVGIYIASGVFLTTPRWASLDHRPSIECLWGSYRMPRVTTDAPHVASIAPHWLHMSQASRHYRGCGATWKFKNFDGWRKSHIFGATVARYLRHVEPVWSKCGAILATCCASVAQQHFLYAFLPRKHFLTRDCRGKWPRFQSQAEIADAVAVCDPSLIKTNNLKFSRK